MEAATVSRWETVTEARQGLDVCAALHRLAITAAVAARRRRPPRAIGRRTRKNRERRAWLIQTLGLWRAGHLFSPAVESRTLGVGARQRRSRRRCTGSDPSDRLPTGHARD